MFTIGWTVSLRTEYRKLRHLYVHSLFSIISSLLARSCSLIVRPRQGVSLQSFLQTQNFPLGALLELMVSFQLVELLSLRKSLSAPGSVLRLSPAACICLQQTVSPQQLLQGTRWHGQGQSHGQTQLKLLESHRGNCRLWTVAWGWPSHKASVPPALSSCTTFWNHFLCLLSPVVNGYINIIRQQGYLKLLFGYLWRHLTLTWS